ncbi:DUF3309 family protein [Mesorhizobium sp. B2-3-4]|uniref:DUF3309 family protein n=1 Tax=Mesorhizobium sp. B2-3-4 TaxID=2589959 RepID=UPI001126EE2E|nr:DUF3309 family protein [Mesorhizobium sp. B2-3-4]TPM38111.1 DUF3309 domain-containing protein [Mesorhizobium sp. B2-3-4]
MTVPGAFSIITLMLVLIFVLPIWPWSRNWAWRPAGILAAILLALLILLFANKI